jgi:hypothetical protein
VAISSPVVLRILLEFFSDKPAGVSFVTPKWIVSHKNVGAVSRRCAFSRSAPFKAFLINYQEARYQLTGE